MTDLVHRITERPVARIALVATGCLAALSMGGGFVVGIVLAPLLVVVAHRRAAPGAWGYAVVAALLAAEVAWGATYLLIGELMPVIWLVPATVGLATFATAVRGEGR